MAYMTFKTKEPSAATVPTSVAMLCEYRKTSDGEVVTLCLDKFGMDMERIEFKGVDAIKLANEFFARLGFKAVRLARDLSTPDGAWFLTDADMPGYLIKG